MNEALFASVFIAVVVVLAVVLSRLLLKWRREGLDAEAKGEVKLAGPNVLLGHIHHIWWLVGVAGGALKFVHRAWRTAPVGSSAKLGWGALLAFIVALGLFVIVKLVDRKLNPPHEMEREASVTGKGFSETTGD